MKILWSALLHRATIINRFRFVMRRDSNIQTAALPVGAVGNGNKIVNVSRRNCNTRRPRYHTLRVY